MSTTPTRRPSSTTVAALRTALARCGEAYRRWLVAGSNGPDTLVLTATHARQAEGYRAELDARRTAGAGTAAFLPESLDVDVRADPVVAGGRVRVGSGGATLAVLRHLERRHGRRELLQRHTLLMHSGGLSQRLPAYSPVGKVFSPLPLLRPDGQPATLFDHLFLTAAAIAPRLGPGLTVMAGDVFLVLDPDSVPDATRSHRPETPLPEPSPLAVGLWVEPSVGTQHGVFITDADGRVLRTLQKASVQQMRDAGAVRYGKVLVDTGLLHFPPAALETLLDLARLPLRPPWVPLDLYETVVGALTPAGVATDPLAHPLAALARHGLTACAARGEFLHLGTTAQFRDALVGPHPSPAAALLRTDVHASHSGPTRSDRRVFAAALAPGTRLGPGSVVEHSLLEPPAAGRHRIGRGSVVSQVRTGPLPLVLPDQTLYFQCPLRAGPAAATPAGFAHVVCGVHDDFKSPAFFGRPLQRHLRRWKLRSRDVWPAEVAGTPAATLWTARLFPVTPDRTTCHAALSLAGRFDRAAWRQLPRVSMADILARVDPAGLLAHREVLAAHRLALELSGRIRDGDEQPLEATVPAFRSEQAFLQLAAVLDAQLTSPLHRARGHYLIAQLAARPAARRLDARRHESLAFSAIAAATERAATGGVADDTPGASPHRPRPRPPARHEVALNPAPVGHRVVATAPVRIDLAGGWTDTPPCCFEYGGHVVNLALLLDGTPPVEVEVIRRAGRGLELTSDDLGKRRRLRTCLRPVPLNDPFALHITALQMLGLADGRLGLTVRTACRVPKGSGLGTSSILAATLLAALARMLGRRPAPARLFEWTLRLEQRLSTGGGWQDQVGGVVGGIKSIVTRPGIPQRLRVRRLDLPAALLDELQARLVVYFTGRQRLARDILRRVVGRYLAREPEAMATLRQLRTDAERLAEALAAGDLSGTLPDVVARYWRCKTRLFPGSSTAAIDALLADAAAAFPGVAGGLAGAGGGGFAYFVCPSREVARRLRLWLADRGGRPGELGVVYPATIARHGLTLDVRRDG